jgi:hypothetical protein
MQLLDRKNAANELSNERAAQVRLHLNELLSSAPFRNSPKCSAFLQYVVEASLAGLETGLKERLIAIDVFGREPEFETANDPIVRVKAGEVRKRLAQYYQGCPAAAPLHIELLPGSYAPVFHWMEEQKEPSAEASPAIAVPKRTGWREMVLPGAIAGAVLIALACAYFVRRSSNAPIDLFWRPLLTSQDRVTIFVGINDNGVTVAPSLQRRLEAREGPVDVADLAVQPGELALWTVKHIGWTDAAALLALNRYFTERHKAVDVYAASQSSQVKPRFPLVFLGLFSNPWTLELMRGLRVAPQRTLDEKNHQAYWLVDKNDPRNPRWRQTHVDPPQGKDYALIAKVNDRNTGQCFIVVGGISAVATLAAAEFATDPERWRSIAQAAPANWHTNSMEIVLEMPIVEGAPGAAQVVAAYFW